MTFPVRLQSLLGLWALFFLLCLGLGYAAVKRYDPAAAGGLGDTGVYAGMVRGEPAPRNPIWLHRALVPYAARPVYGLLKGRTGSWDAAGMSLLVWNAALTAVAAAFVFLLGGRFGLVAALLYLLNFTVTNYLLAGMVDSLQAASLAGLAWCLREERWGWAAALSALGAAGKETTLALAAVFALGWAVAERRNLGRAVAAGMAALAGTQIMPVLLSGGFSNFLAIAGEQQRFAGPGLLVAFLECLTAWNVWLSVGWGAPLAWLEAKPGVVWGDRRWLAAAGAGTVMVLGLGTWSAAGANIARPLFHLWGPMLSIGAAAFLVGRYGGETRL